MLVSGISAATMPGRSVWKLLLLVALLDGGPALAQPGDLRAMAREFKAAQDELRSYAWTRRTEVRIGGKLKEVTLTRVGYDRDGIRQETAVGETEPGKTRGPIRKRRAKKKKKKAAAFNADLQELIRNYTQFAPEQMRSVFERASIFPGVGQAQGTIRIQVRNVLRQGDSLYIWADEVTRHVRKFEILTSLDGDPVKVVTRFRDLENGPTYPAHVTVNTEVKGKPMVIEMENFDFVRQGA